MQALDLFKLEGKVAIVTGGSGLYGQSISIALAEAGARVIVASRQLDSCREFAQTLTKRGLQAEGMALDLSDEAAIVDFTQEVISRYGRIDILVNNAVSRAGFSNLEDMTKAGWEASKR
jgi:NAD(P)-dependent dehydrogenase (short-subunit alcohol dehydrogenase family)